MDIEKKSEELKKNHEEAETLMSEARQIMGKQRKTNKERLAYILKKFELYIKTF